MRAGRAPQSDLEQTNERLEAAKALVSRIKLAAETASAKYRNVVGRKPAKLHSLKYAPGLPKYAGQAFQKALINNPELQVLESDATAAEFDTEQFRSSLYPQLFLEGSATRGEDLEGTRGQNDEYKASVVLRWSLFDGGIRRNREMELSELASQKRIEQQIKARDIREEIDVAWAKLTTGKQEIAAIGNQVSRNKRLVDSYRNEYEADKRSLLDVLNAESGKFASEFEFSNARALNIFASYQLLASMGTLLETMGAPKPAGSSYSNETLGLGAVKFNNNNFSIPPLR